jgi:hypothetical protein
MSFWDKQPHFMYLLKTMLRLIFLVLLPLVIIASCKHDDADIKKFVELASKISMDSLSIAYSQMNDVLKFTPMKPPHYYNYVAKSDTTKKYLPCDGSDTTHRYYTLKGVEFRNNEFYVELTICPVPPEEDVLRLIRPLVKSFKKREERVWIIKDDRILFYSSGEFSLSPLRNETLRPSL